MARKPAVRENYRQDAITIHRIIGAIELDPQAPDVWKEKVKALLSEAMRLMLEQSMPGSSKARKAG